MPKAHFIWGEALLAQQRLSCMWMTELARSLAGSLPLLFVLCFSRSPVSERTKRASERMERRRFGRARACSRPGQVVVRRTIPEKITKTNPKTRTALPVRRPARERGQKKKKKGRGDPPLRRSRRELHTQQPPCPTRAAPTAVPCQSHRRFSTYIHTHSPTSTESTAACSLPPNRRPAPLSSPLSAVYF